MANNVEIMKAKKGDTVLLCMFTGCKTGIKEIIACDKSTITLNTRRGEMVFDRKTGKQIEPMPKNERFASYVVVDDGTFVPAARKKKKAKPEKKASKKSKPEPEVKDEEEQEEKPTPKKEKKATKKTTKKSKPVEDPTPAQEPDDFEDDDFEEVE